MGLLVASTTALAAGAWTLRDEANSVSAPSLLRNDTARRQLYARLALAHTDFRLAALGLQFWSPLLQRLGWVPGAGHLLVAAPPAAVAADRGTAAALELLGALEPVLATPHGLSGIVQALHANNARFLAADRDMQAAAAAMRALPPLPGYRLSHYRRLLRHDVAMAAQATRWLAMAPQLLGVNRPSRYLLVMQNPAQIRATGGFIGAANFVTVRNGRIASIPSGSAFPHETRSIPLPLPEALYTLEGPWIFRDSNWSPDFPLTARWERWFYSADTGRWADGVIDVLDTSMVDILQVTGPVYLPAYGVWVSAGNAQSLANQFINGAYNGPQRRGAPDAVRKQFFGHVFKAVLPALRSLPPSRWPRLFHVVRAAAAQGGILVYDRRPAVEAAIAAAGLDGTFRPVPGDFLAIVDHNLSYNKLDPYVRRTALYQVMVRRDLWLDCTLRLHYTVLPSPADLEGQGPGYGLWGTKHDYLDFVRVYVPPGAVFLSMAGMKKWAPVPAYGLTQIAGRLLLREGQSRTVILHWVVPANAVPNPRRYHLTVRRQPGSNLESIQVMVGGAAGPLVRTLPLQQTATLSAPISGPVYPRFVALPPRRLHTDPYLPPLPAGG